MLVIPVPSFTVSSACPEMKENTKVEYKFTAIGLLSLPKWATFDEFTKEITLDANEKSGLAVSHRKFKLTASYGELVATQTFTVYF